MLEAIEALLAPYRGKPSSLVPALQAIQRRFGYLPPEALRAVARVLGVPLSRVYGVATFYAQFTLHPRGEHVVRVCLGTACHVRGAPLVLEELSRALEVDAHGLSKDGRVCVEVVRCLGACALAPVVVVNQQYYGGMTPGKIRALVRKLLEEEDDQGRQP